MDNSIGFSSGKKDKKEDTLSHWWESPPETVAKDLVDYCCALELSQRPRRLRSYAYHMAATGRAPISYGLSMPGQGLSASDNSYGGDLFDAEYTPPSENCCAIAIDTFENKIWCQRPFLEWTPTRNEDYKLDRDCKQATSYSDQIFSDLNVWDLIQAMGKDSGIVGTGWILGNANEQENSIDLQRVDDDCVLVDPTAGESPRAWQIRWFYDRFDLIKQYAVGDNAKEIKEALELTQGCRLGFFNMPVGYRDTIAVCMGIYLAKGKSPGRYVLAVENCVLADTEYKDKKPPLAKMVWNRISGTVRGKGIVETILPLQREIDRMADNVAEQERICAWNRAQSPVGNNIDIDTLSGNSLIEYTIKEVKFEQGIAPPPQLYSRQKELRQSALFSVGITESQVQGSASPGLTAGVAMQTEMMISDTRHKAVLLQQESTVEDIGDLIIRLARVAKPIVIHEGNKIDFDSVDKAVKNGMGRAFPLSGLPQSIPGRTQEIEDQYRRGQIDQAQYQKLRGLPYLNLSNDEQTAAIDLINFQIDEMLFTGKFQPVLPFSNLKAAKSKAIARYQIGYKRGMKRDRLQLLAMYIAMVNDRIKEQPEVQPAAPTLPAQASAPQGA